MCGICGILRFDSQPVAQSSIRNMMDALVHRGPDDQGDFFNHFPNSPILDRKSSIGLGFRRLSIIDLDGGHQPMQYGDWTIVFNGEIYNFLELKKECERLGHRFKTRSDTEVILHLFAEFGESSVNRLNGMYAFAIWNNQTNTLYMVRDRMGIKPLYYSLDSKKCVFSSEIKSLIHSEEVEPEFDPIGISDFFTYRFVPGPHSILKNVKKVLPGHILKIQDGEVENIQYWDIPKSGPPSSFSSFESAQEELLDLLHSCVRSQMISDVPLGSFLSGGVDSSLITALMTRYTSKKVKTFSIGFNQSSGVDESGWARAVSTYLGTEHYEMRLNEKDLLESDQIFSKMNEPVADPTILPTAILSKFARENVKVVLTGEGGDELFAGYNRYKSVLYSKWVQQLPEPLRPLARAIFKKSGSGESFRSIPNVDAHSWYGQQRDFSPQTLQFFFHKGQEHFNESYLKENSLHYFSQETFRDPLNSVLDLERQTALVDRLLMKVDMASMSHSLEARPPYLDHRLVEFAFKLPDHYKIRRFKGKYILRSAALKVLPDTICWRRKHGFIVPIWSWINSHSQEWFDRYLNNSTLENTGIFDKKSIQKEFKKIYNSKDLQNLSLFWPFIVLSGWAEGIKK